MRGRIIHCAGALALIAASQGAWAMSSAGRAECTVTGGKSLPADSGGADALCAAIKRAVAAKAPGIGFKADVKVLSKSTLSAVIVTDDGRRVPEMRHQVMDAQLTGKSFERFANALAMKLASLPVKAAR